MTKSQVSDFLLSSRIALIDHANMLLVRHTPGNKKCHILTGSDFFADLYIKVMQHAERLLSHIEENKLSWKAAITAYCKSALQNMIYHTVQDRPHTNVAMDEVSMKILQEKNMRMRTSPTIEQDMDAPTKKQFIYREINNLNPLQALSVLYFMDGKEGEEIAEDLGVTHVAVRVARHRAYNILRETLAPLVRHEKA